MKVLVTGAAGFIGSPVVAALARRGAEPMALVRPGTEHPLGVRVFEADYRDASAVAAALRASGATALVHAAWRIASGAAYLRDPENIVDLEASLRLFELARCEGCDRIIGIGTCLEYDVSDDPTAEDAPLVPDTVYGASKAALFLASRAWAAVADVSFAWARLFHPFGPGEAPERLVPTVVNGLLRGERVATTDGHQRRSFLFVEDVGDAIAAITLSNAIGPFNVGSADATSVRELVERIAAVVGRSELLELGALESREGDRDVVWADTARLASEIGWQPKTSLDDAIQKTIAWWRVQA